MRYRIAICFWFLLAETAWPASDYDDWKAPPPSLPTKSIRLIGGKTYILIRENPESGPVFVDAIILQKHGLHSGAIVPLIRVIELDQEQRDRALGREH